jgi:hypothetical protein
METKHLDTLARHIGSAIAILVVLPALFGGMFALGWLAEAIELRSYIGVIGEYTFVFITPFYLLGVLERALAPTP